MIRKSVDWVVIVAALVASTGWMWSTDFGENMQSIGLGMAGMIVLSTALILSACMALTRPALTIAEVCTTAGGLLMIALPHLLFFAHVPEAAWMAYGVGAVVTVMGLLGILLSRAEKRRPMAVSAY
jgi:fumarate reductase subunit D